MNARSPGKGAPRGSSLRCGLGKRSSKGCLGPRCSGLEPQSQRPGAEGSGRTGPGTGPAFPPPRARARPVGSRETRDAAEASGAPPRGRGPARGAARGPRTRARAGLSAQSLPPAGRDGRCRGGARLPGRRGAGSRPGAGEALPAARTLARETKADFPQRNARHLQEGNREVGAGRKAACELGEIRSPLSGLSFIPAAMTSHALFLSRGLSGPRPASLRS